jgi:predicted double-glycine peptidase
MTIASSVTQCSQPSPQNETAALSTISESPQCGHWSMQHVLEILGVPVEMETLLAAMPPKTGGHSLKAIKDTLESLGLNIEGRRESFEQLQSASFPVIAHLNDHFVCVIGTTNDTVLLFDGDGRRKTWSTSEFFRRWTGVLLRVTRNPKDGVLPKTPTSLAAGGPVPRAQFRTLYHDLGEIQDAGSPIQLTFTVVNAGQAALRIFDVKVDCSCITTDFPLNDIQPGDKGRINLTYTSSANMIRGAFLKSAVVKTNDPVTPSISLAIAGNSFKTIELKPNILHFSKLPRSQPVTKLIRVQNHGDIPLQIEGVEDSVPGWNIKMSIKKIIHSTDISVLGAGSHTDDNDALLIKLTMIPDNPEIGTFDGLVTISTNIQGAGRLNIPISGEVVSNITLRPSTLYFGEISAYSNVHKKIQVRTLDGSMFKIIAVRSSLDTLMFEYFETFSSTIEVVITGFMKNPELLNEDPLMLTIRTETGITVMIKLPVYGKLNQTSPK